MIIKNKDRSYTVHKKYVFGKGFVDVFRDVGSYISQNKDLIAKPLLSATGHLAALGLTEGSKMLLSKLMNKKAKMTPKSLELLEDMNIMGSGLKKY